MQEKRTTFINISFLHFLLKNHENLEFPTDSFWSSGQKYIDWKPIDRIEPLSPLRSMCPHSISMMARKKDSTKLEKIIITFNLFLNMC